MDNPCYHLIHIEEVKQQKRMTTDRIELPTFALLISTGY